MIRLILSADDGGSDVWDSCERYIKALSIQKLNGKWSKTKCKKEEQAREEEKKTLNKRGR